MACFRIVASAFLFFLARVHHASALEEKQQTFYFEDGEEITLRPPASSSPITSVLWKWKGNIVAEWDQSGSEIYPKYKDRTTLDQTTGELIIKAITSADAGDYTVEINTVQLDDLFKVSVLKVVKPDVWPSPGLTEDERTLTCDVNGESVGPVQYFWRVWRRKDDKVNWVDLGPKITIKRNETTKDIEFYSCKMVNPVGAKESDPEKNDFYESPSSIHPGAAVGGVLGALFIVMGIVGFIKRDSLKKCFSSIFKSNSAPAVSPEGQALQNQNQGGPA